MKRQWNCIVKKTVCFLMAVALLLTMLPVNNIAFAAGEGVTAAEPAESQQDTQEIEAEQHTEFATEQLTEEIQDLQQTDASVEVQQETQETETEQQGEPVEEQIAETLETESAEDSTSEMELSISSLALTSSYIYEVDYGQEEVNKKKITVSVPNLAKILSMEVADSVKVEANLLYNGKSVQSATKTVKLADIKDSTEFTMEVPTYGKYYVKATFIKSGKAVNTTSESIVGVTAEEYNFAILNATFPVVQFTLSLWDMKGDSENPVPTFVSLSRNDAYDWDCLPENVYDLPYINDSNRESVGYTNKMKMTAYFMKELYELNSDSKFNVYCVDYTLTAILYTIIENRIPQDQYSVKVLSDGTASYSYFNERFNIDNPQSEYDAMAKEWAALKQQYANGNRVSLSSLKYSTSSDTSSLKYYTYVVVNEEKKAGSDIEWWLARTNGTLLSPDTEFLNNACKTVADGGVIRLTAFNTMLNELTSKGDAVQKEFKALYHFSETMFEAAEKNGKQAMMLLGTRVTGEADFEDYARFCMLYYGDAYEYYYKGHPATPTDMYPEKQKQLNSLGIHDVESSIAAELILYFYPNISMSGYDSTTFISASEKMACCLFNKTLDAAYNVTNGCDYKNTIDFCISKITDYTKGVATQLNSEHRNYLIEFNKIVSSSPYDIGVWDATDSCIYYYVLKNGSYVQKAKVLATKPVVEAEGGEKQVTLSWSPVQGADEYRIYSYDASTKKYAGVKRITNGTTTSYTVNGLKDGTKYTYLIRAKVDGIWSSYSTADHVSAYTICAKPVVTAKGLDNSVKLSWKAVNGATKYRVYSYDRETNKYTKLGETTATSVTYKNLEDGTEYVYLVRAYNESGFSPFTRADNVAAITLCKKPSVIAYSGQKSITLSWSSVPGAVYYRVYKYYTDTQTYKGLANVTKNTYTINNLKAGTNYFYLVRAYNGKSYSTYTKADNIHCKTTCISPTVKATAGKSSVTLSWSAPKGATKYRVYSYNATTKKYTRLFDTKNTKCTITNLKKGTTYRYLVRAYNGTTFSDYSYKNVVRCIAK